ncbi:Pyrimidine nucleotide transporter, mitochondrial [Saitoella coloradoensis]
MSNTSDLTNITARPTSPAAPPIANDAQVVQKQAPAAWAHFAAGGLAGMSGALATSPLDVVKTRLQSDFYKKQLLERRVAHGTVNMGIVKSGFAHFADTFHILTNIYRVEGPKALFKGLGPNLVGVIPARAINFFMYGNGKRIIADNLNGGKEAAWVHVTAAITAGITTSTCTNPIWLIKTRLQLDKQKASTGGAASRQYKNSLDCFMQTVRNEGVRGLYRGLSASYLGVAESSLQWVVYEELKRRIAERSSRRRLIDPEPTTMDVFIEWAGKSGSAGIAKVFAAGIAYPHEVIRTRLRQAPMENGKQKYTGLVQCFRIVLKEEGVAALYGGLTAHMMRVVPNAAIMFGSYELFLSLVS